MKAFSQLTLVHRFLLTGCVVLLAGMLIVGTWVGKQIEIGVINRTGVVISLYVESFVFPHLQSLARSDELRDTDRAALNHLLSATPLGRQIVAFKIWRPDGHVIYSTNPAIVGRQFPVKAALASAFAGTVHSQIADLTEPENAFEAERWSRLIETYTPVYAEHDRKILAVAEFYQTPEDLEREVGAAQLRSWLMVVSATLMMFVLLAGLVRRAHMTIVAQQTELRDKVAQLTALLAQNERLHDRVRRAAARTTALNERFLHRVAADLHDGPGQGLALALLRMGALADVCAHCPNLVGKALSVGQDFRTVHGALQTALEDLRAIAAGLHLPEITELTLTETARRAVHDYERKSGLTVPLSVGEVSDEAPLPVKITLFRLLQESLANGYRHSGSDTQRVRIAKLDGQLLVEVADEGKGFNPQAAAADGHLGLTGMRERVETLGGSFSVESAPGKGSIVKAMLPLALVEQDCE